MVAKEKDLQKEEIKRDLIERSAPPFNLQAEISKVKIAIPFNEIIRIPEYRGKLSHMIKSEETSDTLNLQDDKPKIMFGPRLKHPSNLKMSLHSTSTLLYMTCFCTMPCLIRVLPTI